jgi:hypothetical protein
MPGGKAEVTADLTRITEIMEDYRDVIVDDMRREAEQVAREAADRLRADSPYDASDKGRHYRDLWTSKLAEQSDEAVKYHVYNSKKWQISHLLEFGHLTRDGTSRTPASPHTKPVYDWAQDEYERRVEAKL